MTQIPDPTTNSPPPPSFFKVSLGTSTILTLLGLVILVLPTQSPTVLLAGFICLVVGLVQLVADLGWLALKKTGEPPPLTWAEAFDLVGQARGQKLWVLPIVGDLVVLGVMVGVIFWVG